MRGWLVLFLVAGALAVGLVRGVYPFLAVNDPKPGGVLVVEGWGSEESMQGVIEEFKRNRYDSIYSIGGPIEGSSPLVEYKTLAEYGAVVLTRLGCDPKVVHAIPTPRVVKDRTYSSAVALKQWLKDKGVPATTVNVYSTGTHSRRSRLLFQKAFGDEVQIGVVASEDREFDPKRWWASSIGFRNVTSEAIAYCYARFLFHPTAE
jgi:hypothetical protein